MKRILFTLIGSLSILAATPSVACEYVLENGTFVWKCDPDPGSSSCRYVYECGAQTSNGCEYVWRTDHYVLECGNGTPDCQYVWTCGR